MASIRFGLAGILSASLTAFAAAASIRTPHRNADTRGTPKLAEIPPFITAQDDPIVLSSTTGKPGILVLDYGVETEGIPTFEVVTATGNTSTFEMTYAETEAALALYMVRSQTW